MTRRPNQRWQDVVAEQEKAVVAGTLPREEAYAAELWPADFTTAVDAALANFERDVDGLDAARDDEVWAAVERVVLALNAIDEPTGLIETGEREELAQYIDDVLTGAGVDVPALTSRRGLERGELTDTWRDW